MIMPATLLIGFSLTVSVADAVPHYDMKPTCRAAVALAAGGDGGRSIENCMAGEEQARKQIDKARGRPMPIPG
jgi:hypothetical protein